MSRLLISVALCVPFQICGEDLRRAEANVPIGSTIEVVKRIIAGEILHMR